MRITRSEDIAILVMAELSRNQARELLSLTSIAHHHGLSPLFLKKIARDLRRAGLVESKEGIAGGYRVAKSPRDITVWEVLRAVGKSELESPRAHLAVTRCPLKSPCLPQEIRKSLSLALAERFQTLTLSELIGKS